MHVYQIGKLYHPDRRSWPEATQLRVRNNQHELLFFFRSPKKVEVDALQNGQMQFALVQQEGLIFLLYRVGFAPDAKGRVPPGWVFPWSDAPFNWWDEAPEERALPNPEPGQQERVLLVVSLINADTGILLVQRALTLGPELSAALGDAIRAQAKTPISRDQVNAIMQRTYARFPQSSQMLAIATAQAKGGE